MAVDTSVPKAEDYEAVPNPKCPSSPKTTKQANSSPNSPSKSTPKTAKSKKCLKNSLPLITQQLDEETGQRAGRLPRRRGARQRQTCSGPKATSTATLIFKSMARATPSTLPRPAHQNRQRQRGHPRRTNDENLASTTKMRWKTGGVPLAKNYDQDGWNARVKPRPQRGNAQNTPLAKLTTHPGHHQSQCPKKPTCVIVEQPPHLLWRFPNHPAHTRYPEAWFPAWRVPPRFAARLDNNPRPATGARTKRPLFRASVQSRFRPTARRPRSHQNQRDRSQTPQTGNRYPLRLEYGIGGRIAYDYYNLFNKGYIGSIVWDMDKYETTLRRYQPTAQQPRQLLDQAAFPTTAQPRKTAEKRALTSGIWYVRDRTISMPASA